MAKVTQAYETVIVISTKDGEENVKAIVEKFSDLISKNGTLDSVDEWGKRRLAYPINYETEGYYVLYNYTSEPKLPAEIERVLSINDSILRFLTVAK